MFERELRLAGGGATARIPGPPTCRGPAREVSPCHLSFPAANRWETDTEDDDTEDDMTTPPEEPDSGTPADQAAGSTDPLADDGADGGADGGAGDGNDPDTETEEDPRFA